MVREAPGRGNPTAFNIQIQPVSLDRAQASPKQSVIDRFNSYTTFTSGKTTTSDTVSVCSVVSNFFCEPYNISTERKSSLEDTDVFPLFL